MDLLQLPKSYQSQITNKSCPKVLAQKPDKNLANYIKQEILLKEIKLGTWAFLNLQQHLLSFQAQRALSVNKINN